MSADEVMRLIALAQRLGSSPRRVLVAAACAVDHPDATAMQTLAALRRAGGMPFPAAEECADLLLTPVGSFARDSVANAFAALWPTPISPRD